MDPHPPGCLSCWCHKWESETPPASVFGSALCFVYEEEMLAVIVPGLLIQGDHISMRLSGNQGFKGTQGPKPAICRQDCGPQRQPHPHSHLRDLKLWARWGLTHPFPTSAPCAKGGTVSLGAPSLPPLDFQFPAVVKKLMIKQLIPSKALLLWGMGEIFEDDFFFLAYEFG